MGQTLFEIQKQFNNLLLNGVGYNILNNPIISWDNGFIKTLTAVCMLIAIVDAASKIADHKIFLTSVLKLAFAFVLVLMNFGQINPRTIAVDEMQIEAVKEARVSYQKNGGKTNEEVLDAMKTKYPKAFKP